eukprot:365829-Chlamydomonas_euryale.AAC.8
MLFGKGQRGRAMCGLSYPHLQAGHSRYSGLVICELANNTPPPGEQVHGPAEKITHVFVLNGVDLIHDREIEAVWQRLKCQAERAGRAGGCQSRAGQQNQKGHTRLERLAEVVGKIGVGRANAVFFAGGPGRGRRVFL